MTPNESVILAGWLAELLVWIGLPMSCYWIYRYFDKRKKQTSANPIIKKGSIFLLLGLGWIFGRTIFVLTFYEEAQTQSFDHVLGGSIFWVWVPLLIYGLTSWIYNKRKKAKFAKLI